MHRVTGGDEKQLAGMMMQAEADIDELIMAYSQVSCNHFLTAAVVIALSDAGQQRICACLGCMPQDDMRCRANSVQLVFL